MNIKEFNDKKQCIIDELNEVNAEQKPMQYGQYSWLFNKIQELQPPKPTCSTCELYNDCNIVDKLIETDEYEDLDKERINFGCIHHSDYEVKNEKN